MFQDFSLFRMGELTPSEEKSLDTKLGLK